MTKQEKTLRKILLRAGLAATVLGGGYFLGKYYNEPSGIVIANPLSERAYIEVQTRKESRHDFFELIDDRWYKVGTEEHDRIRAEELKVKPIPNKIFGYRPILTGGKR